MTSRDSQAGFTIIEVLVTAIIVMVMSAGIALALVSAAGATGDQRTHAEADAIAAQDQERLRGLSDAELVALGSAGTTYPAKTPQTDGSDSDGTAFTVTSSATPETAKGVSSCTVGGASEFLITSNVSWQDPSGTARESVTVQSLMARPTTGDLITEVDDQTGNPLPGAKIVATGSDPVDQTPSDAGESESGMTDSSGCSAFAGLSQGGYNVAYSYSNWINPLDVPDPTYSLSEDPTGTPQVNTENLGLGGTIKATLQSPAYTNKGVVYGPFRADASTLSYEGVDNGIVGTAPTQMTTPIKPLGSSTVTTPNPVFPWDVASSSSATPSYQSNYSVWAGACAAQEPPAGAYQGVASVIPGGQSAPATVDEPELVVPTVDLPGLGNKLTAVVPTAFKLTFTASGSTSCTDSWSPLVASPSPANSTKPPSSGWLFDPGQPYADGKTGTLTVCASYTKAGTTVSGSEQAVNTSFTGANTLPTAIILSQPGGCS